MEKDYYPKYPKIYPQLMEKVEAFSKPTDTGIKSALTKLSYSYYIDKDGFPHIVFGSLYGGTPGDYYSMPQIPLYALSNYNAFIETEDKKKKEKYKRRCLKMADWLVEHFTDKGDRGYWQTLYLLKGIGYCCKPPFISALVQGLGISALVRAYSLTKDEKYKGVMKKVLGIYEISVPDGGITTIDKNRDFWYEEYPCLKKDPNQGNQVLNGFITALLGPYEYYKLTGDEKAKKIFDKGIKTLKKHISDYELNLLIFKCSRYDRHGMFYAQKSYHRTHINQLKMLYDITGDDIFLEYHRKWEGYEEKYDWLINIINIPILAFMKILKILNF